MKLSRIYSNRPEKFECINFNRGLNVILGEIRDPTNKDKDTHNLGKSILSRLIDFCLLKSKDKEFFLFKHEDIFKGFVFFLEIECSKHSYLTIRRPVIPGTKISIKKHFEKYQDFTNLPEDDWDHLNLGFQKAEQILDGLLDYRVLSPFDFRHALGYSLRVQKDYNSVFQLSKHLGKHSDWKPFLAKILGFNEKLVIENYRVSEDISRKQDTESILKNETIGISDDPDKLEGILLIRREEASQLEEVLSNYDFQISDSEVNRELIEDIEYKTSTFNEKRYVLSKSKKRIEDSLNEKIIFNPDNAAKLFSEVSVYFAGQLKKDFDDLIRFNKAITKEREEYLRQELKELSQEIDEINIKLADLSAKRSAALTILKEKQTFQKYRKYSENLVSLKTEVRTLERQKLAIDKLGNLQHEIQFLQFEQIGLKEEIKKDVDAQSVRYKNIRLYFNEIVKKTINRNAVLSTRVNDKGNLEFSAAIINDQGLETSQSEGHTYLKFLCIAFDMALIRAYSNDNYIHFLYHDGALETLDNRKKLNLIDIMRNYCQDFDIQHIITLIDSDLPFESHGERFHFKSEEIILLLHDADDNGRLFKMPMW